MQVRVALAAAVMAACDVVWFALFGHYWQRAMESIAGRPLRMRLWAAAVVYLAGGQLLTYATTTVDAFVIGACAYAIYDFTTLVLFDRYMFVLALVDTLWGGLLFAIAHNVVALVQ